jgi:DNA segregation ATPase FtsK/SpoIIIE-like protein
LNRRRKRELDEEGDADLDEDAAGTNLRRNRKRKKPTRKQPREVVPAAPAVGRLRRPKAKIQETRFDPPTPPPGPWTFPPIDLLLPPERTIGVDDAFLEASAAKLENALRSFKSKHKSSRRKSAGRHAYSS